MPHRIVDGGMAAHEVGHAFPNIRINTSQASAALERLNRSMADALKRVGAALNEDARDAPAVLEPGLDDCQWCGAPIGPRGRSLYYCGPNHQELHLKARAEPPMPDGGRFGGVPAYRYHR